jgi:hypothetical protein
VSALVAKVELAPPVPKTGRMSSRQRDQLAEARRERWRREGGV